MNLSERALFSQISPGDRYLEFSSKRVYRVLVAPNLSLALSDQVMRLSFDGSRASEEAKVLDHFDDVLLSHTSQDHEER